MQASLCVRKYIGSRFHHFRSLVKVAHARSSVGQDSENSSHYCGSPENLVHTCFSVRRDLDSSVRGQCEAWVTQVECQERPRKCILPVWRRCKACACILDVRCLKKFLTTGGSYNCQGCLCQFENQEGSGKQCSAL